MIFLIDLQRVTNGAKVLPAKTGVQGSPARGPGGWFIVCAHDSHRE